MNDTCPKCGQECDTMSDPDTDHMISTCCYSAIRWRCPSCSGEQFVYEDDYECDWINFDHDFITCPECNGSGYVSELTWQ